MRLIYGDFLGECWYIFHLNADCISLVLSFARLLLDYWSYQATPLLLHFSFLWFLLIFIYSSLTCVQFKTLKFLLCLSLENFFTNFFIFDCTVLLSWWQIEVLPTLGWLPKTFYFFQSPSLIFIRTFKLLSILVKFLHPVFKLKQLDNWHPCKYSDR